MDYSTRPDFITVSIRQDWDMHYVEMFIAGRNRFHESERTLMPATISFGEPESIFIRHGPTLWLEDDALQLLFDQMWQLGLRPSKGIARPEDEVKAIASHLEDMRQIAFSRLKVEKP